MPSLAPNASCVTKCSALRVPIQPKRQYMSMPHALDNRTDLIGFYRLIDELKTLAV